MPILLLTLTTAKPTKTTPIVGSDSGGRILLPQALSCLVLRLLRATASSGIRGWVLLARSTTTTFLGRFLLEEPIVKHRQAGAPVDVVLFRKEVREAWFGGGGAF